MFREVAAIALVLGLAAPAGAQERFNTQSGTVELQVVAEGLDAVGQEVEPRQLCGQQWQRQVDGQRDQEQQDPEDRNRPERAVRLGAPEPRIPRGHG